MSPVEHAVAHWALPRTFFASASAPGSRPGPLVSARRRSGRALSGCGKARGTVAPWSAARRVGRAGVSLHPAGAGSWRSGRAGPGCGEGQRGGGAARGHLKPFKGLGGFARFRV